MSTQSADVALVRPKYDLQTCGPVMIYEYLKADGSPLFRKLCSNTSGKRAKFERYEGGFWVPRLDGITERPLFNQNLIAGADTVLITDDERDAHSLALKLSKDAQPSLGFSACVTNSDGPNSWRPQYNNLFAKKHSLIFETNNDTSRKRAKMLVKVLGPITASLKVVALPGLSEHTGIADWLETHRLDELVEFIDGCNFVGGQDEVDPSEWNGKLPVGWENMTLPFHKTLPRVSDLKISEIEDELVEGLLPRGITIVAAASGVGKSWFCQSLAKSLISGEAFAGRFIVPERTPVTYLMPEISAQSFITRCEKLDLRKYGGWLTVRTMDSALKGLDDEDLVAAVRALRPVVFLDTLIRFGSADENSASENRALFDKIASLINCLSGNTCQNMSVIRENRASGS